MKFLRSLLAVFLVLVIVGGLGYIGWSMFYAPMNHTGNSSMGNMPGMNNSANNQTPSTQTPNNNHQMPNTQHPQNNTAQKNVALNTIAIQNKDKINQAIGTINQAIDLISIDPYSRATVPNPAQGSMGNMQGQTNQGGGSVNVFPSGNSTVNVVPPVNNTPNNVSSSTNTNMGAMTGQQNTNYVYDQGKLQQLNNGIYTLAQGIMQVNQLSEDLTIQSAASEDNPPTYQTYISRYNIALQNKTKLNNAISMINQASTLVNVNPYASPNGYQINVPEMERLHQGVYKLAQGMTMLSRLNDDFTTQMAQAASLAQNMASAGNMNSISGMNMSGMGLNINLPTIFNIVLIIMIIGLIIGILGAIASMFRKRPEKNGGNNPGREPDSI
ncbi:MAG: hypothetical protein N3F66_14625 [Spirochaetes bacterium]|nr:hypothetical protein [Spirochaetota bacterium]